MDHLRGGSAALQGIGEPADLVGTEEGSRGVIIGLAVGRIDSAIGSLVEEEDFEVRPLADLAIDSVGVGRTDPDRLVFEEGLASARGEEVDRLHGVPSVVEDLGDLLLAFECNPVVVTATGVCAVDTQLIQATR